MISELKEDANFEHFFVLSFLLCLRSAVEEMFEF